MPDCQLFVAYVVRKSSAASRIASHHRHGSHTQSAEAVGDIIKSMIGAGGVVSIAAAVTVVTSAA